jgi:ATP-dependent DNA helicase RecG
MSQNYPGRESKHLELKSAPPNFQMLIKTCVAFANGIGGKVVIGVEDKTRKIVGIDENIRKRIYDEFPNSLYDTTSPPLLAEIYERRFGDKSVIIIEVPYSIKKPVYIKSEGIPNGVYLRAGSNNRRAGQEYVEELERENRRISYDEEILYANTDILSTEILKRIYGNYTKQRLISEKIVKMPSNSTKFSPTIAGTLLFCNEPERYIPEAIILCTRFHGIAGREIIQSEEIRGNLEIQIDTSFRLVRSWLLREYRLLDTKLFGKTIIPEEALREAIINAVIHRKYWIPGAIKIALYDNRLEIFNPGNFPGLVDLTHLGDGTTYLRNPILARIARRFGIIEKLGTGIKLIFDSCLKAKIKRPEYIEGADSVKIIFNFLPSEELAYLEQDKLLLLFESKKEISIRDVEIYSGVSRNTATRKLNELIKLGKIQRRGKGPAVRYTLK